MESLLAAISEVAIAKEVGIYNDTIRVGYPFYPNKIESFEEFTDAISNYCSYHYSQCCQRGEPTSLTGVSTLAIRIVEQEYRSCGGDIFTAYKDVRDGTSGGLMVILDRIAERLKGEAIERYIEDVFERYMSPVSWEAKVEIIRQFIARHDQDLPSSILNDRPEKYADNYHELIREYVVSLKKRSPIFRVLPSPGKVG